MVEQKDIYDMLSIMMEDITDEQKVKIEKLAKSFKNPSKIDPREAMKKISDTGIDIEELQKKARKRRYEEKLKTKGKKIGRNETCDCGSGKKYKKCCGNAKKTEISAVEKPLEIVVENSVQTPAEASAETFDTNIETFSAENKE